jgi:hypothetical protein
MEIDQGEEIDGAELGVDGRRTAEAAGNFEVGAKETRGAWGRKEFAGLLAARGGMRNGAKVGLDEIFVAQGVIEGETLVLILRAEGTAADEIARVAESGVGGDALPKQG